MTDDEIPLYLLSVDHELTQRQLDGLTEHLQTAFEDAGFDEGEVVIMNAGELTSISRVDLEEVLE